MSTATLTYKEMQHVERLLLKRHQRTGDKNLLGIGFGIKVKNSRLEHRAGLVVHYVVKRKLRKGLPLKHRAKKHVTVTIKRGGKQVRVTLPTDVIAMRLAHTGAEVTGNQETVTTGIVCRWQENAFHYGIVTVMHGFDGFSGSVTIKPPGGSPFNGVIIARAAEVESLDAALIEIPEQDAAQFTFNNPQLMSAAALAAQAEGSVGRSLRADGNPSNFITKSFSPSGFADLGVPARRDSLLVSSQFLNAFEEGTSGSAWLVGDRPAAMQFAGDRASHSQGLAQSMETVVHWADRTISGTDFEVVSVF